MRKQIRERNQKRKQDEEIRKETEKEHQP